jgi:CO dehydrogenase/acetyl-CoA synthase alpha subunit
MKKKAYFRADEADTGLGKFKGLEVRIGTIVDDEWDEPMGPTPMPGPTTLRNWDHKLLTKYQPSISHPTCPIVRCVVSVQWENVTCLVQKEVLVD